MAVQIYAIACTMYSTCSLQLASSQNDTEWRQVPFLMRQLILLIREEERRKYNADKKKKNERVREKESSFAFEDKYLIESINHGHSDCERLVHSPPCMRIEPRHFWSNTPPDN